MKLRGLEIGVNTLKKLAPRHGSRKPHRRTGAWEPGVKQDLELL
jgi:hypothetical protein